MGDSVTYGYHTDKQAKQRQTQFTQARISVK